MKRSSYYHKNSLNPSYSQAAMTTTALFAIALTIMVVAVSAAEVDVLEVPDRSASTMDWRGRLLYMGLPPKFGKPSQMKRVMALGRHGFRPGKRSIAVLRTINNPEEYSSLLSSPSLRDMSVREQEKRSAALGRSQFRPGKRSMPIEMELLGVPYPREELEQDNSPLLITEPEMGKRSAALGRTGFRPAKRSMAVGRSGFRPGKRSIATGRAGFRPGKRSPEVDLNEDSSALLIEDFEE